MTTLDDVARTAGVSVATASAVLSGRGRQRRISEATATRVRAAAEALGYRAHAAARALAKGSPRTIAFAAASLDLDVLTSAYTAHMLAGVVNQAHLRGFETCITGAAAAEGGYLGQALAAVAQRRCDGAILAGDLLARDASAANADIRAHPQAALVIIEPGAVDAAPAVHMDWRPGIDAACIDLARNGHRAAWWITEPRRPGAPIHERTALVAAACAAHGIAVESRREDDLVSETGQLLAGCQDWLLERSAAIAFNDALAVRLLRACADAGVRVPREISVVSFDAVEALVTVPQLSSVDHRYAELGQAAVELLVEVLAAPPAERRLPRQRTVAARYRRGASVAQARGR